MRWIPCLGGLIGIVLLSAAVPSAQESGSQKVRIVSVEGKRTLSLGERANYIIQINPDASQPIDYYWDAGDGVFIQGRSVVLQFDKEGEYTLTVTSMKGCESLRGPQVMKQCVQARLHTVPVTCSHRTSRPAKSSTGPALPSVGARRTRSVSGAGPTGALSPGSPPSAK